MKRLVHQDFSYIFEFEEGYLHSLVIENRPFFRTIINQLYDSCCGHEDKLVLSQDYSPIPFSKNAELITQFVPFDINKKSLLTKLYSQIEKEAMNGENYQKTQELLASIERYFCDITFSFPYEFTLNQFNISNIIKSTGIIINNEYEYEPEKILDYMSLVRELDNEKVFIFVNMRSYFSDDDMLLFENDVIKNKYLVLLIDNFAYPKMQNEKRLIIDADLCEIF